MTILAKYANIEVQFIIRDRDAYINTISKYYYRAFFNTLRYNIICDNKNLQQNGINVKIDIMKKLMHRIINYYT